MISRAKAKKRNEWKVVCMWCIVLPFDTWCIVRDKRRGWNRGIEFLAGFDERTQAFVTFTVVGVSRALTARRFNSPYHDGTNDLFFSFSHTRHTRAPTKFARWKCPSGDKNEVEMPSRSSILFYSYFSHRST